MAHSLVSTNFTFTEANTVGGVAYSRNINPDANFRLGCAAMAQIEFVVLDYNDDILTQKVVYPIVFSDGTTYLTLDDGTKVGIYQKTVSIDIVGEEFLYTQDGITVGYFTVDRVERVDSLKVKIIAYDRMHLLEGSADEWLASLTFPMTTTEFITALYQQAGLPSWSNYRAINTGYKISRNFTVSGVTYRDLLQWVCEIRGQFATINNAGGLRTGYYASTATVYNVSKTMGTHVAEYDIEPFQGVQVQATEGDLGITVGSGTPKYTITGNPFLTVSDDTTKNRVTSAAQNILSRVSTVSYTPASFSIWDTATGMLYGDIVTLKTAHNPNTGYTVYVMNETWCNQQHTIECIGTQDNINRRSASTVLKQLEGKTAEIKYDLDGLSSTYTNFATQTTSQIQQNSDEISLKVSKTGIADALNTTKQINGGGSEIKISQDKIDIQGLVKFTNLTTAGQTKINGGNITTGTIDAQKVTIKNLDASKITAGSLSADRISGGTINADLINVTNLNASNITQGTLNGNSIGITNLSASNISSGTLSTSRLNASATSDYLSNTGTLLKKNGTFSGAIAWNNGASISNNGSRVVITGSGYPIQITGGSLILAFSGGTVTSSGQWTHNGSWTVTGNKNAAQKTEHYGWRKQYAYETAESFYGDIGENEVVNGECAVYLDKIFMECVNTNLPYQVFLTPYGKGQIWVDCRLPDVFIVKGDNIKFGWELKAKRKGYEGVRLEEHTIESEE